MANFSHCFIPGCAATPKHLNEILAATKGNITLTRDDATTAAFADIKNAPAIATLLVHPSHTNAPMHQRPIAYFSKALKLPGSHYSTFDRGLLAIYLAIKHFRHLRAHSFHVHSDHNYELAARSDHYSPWQTRHLNLIYQIFVMSRVLTTRLLMLCPG